MTERGNDAAAVRDRWVRVEALFDEALERPPAERGRWVRAQSTDPGIAAEVLALIAASEAPGVLDRALPVELLGAEGAASIEARLGAALAGRYRIEEVLGEGGMATVFRAHETKHDRAVVLKVLRPEVAQLVGAERFRTEIQILARLSHPHILALLDSGEADGLLYYVMPFVQGATLRDRLRDGALRLEDSLPLLRDIAAALAHAHAEGLVHRDLKPDNILVADGHAFLMDFGVAKLLRQSVAGRGTVEGFAIGTPAYMAPEQAAGIAVDARADVYSWGIVARELLVGRVGSAGRLPRAVPGALVALIDRALSADPADRPRDGAELQAALAPIGASRFGGPRRRAVGIAAVAMAAVAAGMLWTGLPSAPAPAEVSVGPVMVAPLRNETGDSTLEVWGRMAGDWLTQGLHQTERVTVVPWPVALQVATAATVRPGVDIVRGYAAESDARTVVTGAYYLTGDRVRIQVQVTDVADRSAVSVLPPVEVPRDSMQAGIRQLGERLRGAFAIRTDQLLSDLPGLVESPPTYEAYRSFERGIERFNALDYGSASGEFIAAWRADTAFVTPLVYAATALMNQSEYARAESVVTALRGRTHRLNPYHELMVRFTEASLAGDQRLALEMARQATARAPGGRSQYNVATTALEVGRVDEAIAALESMDPDRGILRGWAPYWLVLAHAQHLKGDAAAEFATTAQLRRRHPDRRSGWVHEVRALASVGRVAEADSVVRAAMALPPDTYWSQGAMLVTIGEELDAHGHPGGAAFLHRAIEWLANQLARDPSHSAHRYWIGSAFLDLGIPADAEPYFESLVEDFPTSVQFRGLHGLVAAWRGDSALARRRLGPAPAFGRGDHLAFLARYAQVAGQRERAIALWSEAVGTGLGGIQWMHASARREIAGLESDPRFRSLGILPGGGATRD